MELLIISEELKINLTAKKAEKIMQDDMSGRDFNFKVSGNERTKINATHNMIIINVDEISLVWDLVSTKHLCDKFFISFSFLNQRMPTALV